MQYINTEVPRPYFDPKSLFIHHNRTTAPLRTKNWSKSNAQTRSEAGSSIAVYVFEEVDQRVAARASAGSAFPSLPL